MLRSIRQLLRFIKHEHGLCLIVAGIVLAMFAASILFGSNLIISLSNKKAGEAPKQEVQAGINADLAKLSSVSKRLATSDLVSNYLHQRDTSSLISLSLSEAQKENLSGIIFTDKDGIALSKRVDSGKRGDYVFQSTNWGAQVAQNRSIATADVGAIQPLIFVAGEPILENGALIGSVFSIYNPVDSYAQAFRERYLSSGVEVAFMGRSSIVGSSFKDPADRLLVSQILQSSKDIEDTLQGRAKAGIEIGTNHYILQRIPLQGINGEVGSVLIFTPSVYGAVAIVIAAQFTVWFFILIVLVHAWRYGRRHTIQHGLFWSLFSLIIFIVIFTTTFYILDGRVLRLNEPKQQIYNSTLRFSPDSGIVDRAMEQVIAVTVASGGEAINALQVSLSYDPTAIKVLDILTDNSFCDQDLLLEKNIDQANGTVDFSCIIPSPGFSDSQGVVMELAIQPLKAGPFSLRFNQDKTSVLANDGLATDVLREVTDGSYQVADELSYAKGADTPIAIFSTTHPNTERWYQQKNVSFVWPGRDGHSYEYYLKDPAGIDSQPVTTSENHTTVTLTKDGVYHFYLTPILDKKRETTSSYTIKLDTTPPAAPTIEASDTTIKVGDLLRLKISSNDQGSGLQNNYYLKFDDGVFLPIGSMPTLPFSESGKHTITVRAFDKAENYNDSTLTIDVQGDSLFSRWFRVK